jgi:hypothetical protein
LTVVAASLFPALTVVVASFVLFSVLTVVVASLFSALMVVVTSLEMNLELAVVVTIYSVFPLVMTLLVGALFLSLSLLPLGFVTLLVTFASSLSLTSAPLA